MSPHSTPKYGRTRQFLIPWLSRVAAMCFSILLGFAILSRGGAAPSASVKADSRETATIQVYSQPDEPTYGDSITLGAWITCGQDRPTGKVLFRDGSAILAELDVTETSVEYNAGKLAAGSHDIQAEYSGDATCTAVSGHTDLIIGSAVFLTLGSNKNPSQVGDLVTFTASTGSPFCNGTMDFTTDGSPAATVPVSGGSASFSTSALSAGAHNIGANNTGGCGPVTPARLIQYVGVGQPACLFGDGRINCRAEDAAQTAAIYCTAGGVTVWAVPNGADSGEFAFTVTAAELAAVPANPTVNTLIKRADGITLYRLVGGKLQINGPKGYVYIWQSC